MCNISTNLCLSWPTVIWLLTTALYYTENLYNMNIWHSLSFYDFVILLKLVKCKTAGSIGVQEQSPWSEGHRGKARPEAELF